MSFIKELQSAGKSLLGLVILAGSGYAEWLLLHQNPIDRALVGWFLLSASIGAVLIVPTELKQAASNLIALYKEWKSS